MNTINKLTGGRSLATIMPSRRDNLIFWSIAVTGTAADLWTKSAVFNWLNHHESFTVIDGVFYIITTVNDGAAFGIASGKRSLLTAASFAALAAIVILFLFGQIRDRLVTVALGMFTAGICGNLYDRLFNHGCVRDFIDIVYWPGKHWPAFNIADSLLCVGVGLMFINIYITGESEDK